MGPLLIIQPRLGGARTLSLTLSVPLKSTAFNDTSHYPLTVNHNKVALKTRVSMAAGRLMMHAVLQQVIRNKGKEYSSKWG